MTPFTQEKQLFLTRSQRFQSGKYDKECLKIITFSQEELCLERATWLGDHEPASWRILAQMELRNVQLQGDIEKDGELFNTDMSSLDILTTDKE